MLYKHENIIHVRSNSTSYKVLQMEGSQLSKRCPADAESAIDTNLRNFNTDDKRPSFSQPRRHRRRQRQLLAINKTPG